MITKRNILVFIGTRPEAVKLAPVVAALRETSDFRCTVVATGQHKEMFRQVAETFGIAVDADLDVMRPNQTLAALTARLIDRIDGCLELARPDMALVQGDTTTVLAASLACFYRRIPIGHVEAGLRTGNIWSPFPEEANRRLAAPLVTLHFAPTEAAREALVREAVPDDAISVTGNTVIDALRMEVARQADNAALRSRIDKELSVLVGADWEQVPTVLITGHRRENFGRGIEANLQGDRDAGRALSGPPFRLSGAPQPQCAGARQPPARSSAEYSSHRAARLQQFRGAHGALPIGADRLGRGPGGGAVAGQACLGDARHHRTSRGRRRRHRDSDRAECLLHRGSCHSASHRRGGLSVHGHRQQSLRRWSCGRADRGADSPPLREPRISRRAE